jgi:hypothetical protein
MISLAHVVTVNKGNCIKKKKTGRQEYYCTTSRHAKALNAGSSGERDKRGLGQVGKWRTKLMQGPSHDKKHGIKFAPRRSQTAQ